MPATLALYLGRRYLAFALPLFGMIFFLIYAVDLIELFRRGADSSKASAGALALLALLRTPFIAEETLPFVALFAAMALFLVLSRRLELVSARSAGVSAWQFIAPVALAAALLGEAWDIRDRIVSDISLDLAGDWHDIWNTLFWPSVILALARTSRLFAASAADQL